MGKTDRLEVAVSRKQIVFLTIIAAMAAVAAFLFGVQVGRGVGEREAGGAEPAPFAAPVDDGGGFEGATPPAGDADALRLGGLSYFERLRGAGPVPETLDFGADPRTAAVESTASAAFVDAPAGSFLVQVMSVSGGAAAREVKAGLEAKGYPVVVEPMPRAPGALHRVGVGPFADRAEADRVSRRLRAEERFDPWVTQP